MQPRIDVNQTGSSSKLRRFPVECLPSTASVTLQSNYFIGRVPFPARELSLVYLCPTFHFKEVVLGARSNPLQLMSGRESVHRRGRHLIFFEVTR